MQNYKDSNNKLYALDSDEFESLLPKGCVPITQTEADNMSKPKPLTATQKRALLKPLSPAQVRLVLNQFGLLAQVESAVAAGDKTLQVEWEFRNEFARDNVTLLIMATALGMTEAQLDNMFEIGITL